VNVTISMKAASDLKRLLNWSQFAGNEDVERLAIEIDSAISAASGTKLDDQAAELYEMYPRKAARPHAIRAIKAAIKKIGFEVLREHVEKYTQRHIYEAIEMRFTPMPATWFNQERWNDQPVSAAPAVKPHEQLGQLRLKIRNSPAFRGGPYHTTCATAKDILEFEQDKQALLKLSPNENFNLLRT
jgi:hypothetical protein